MSIEAAADSMKKTLKDPRGHAYTQDLALVVWQINRATQSGLSSFTFTINDRLDEYVFAELCQCFIVDVERTYLKYKGLKAETGWKYTATLRW